MRALTPLVLAAMLGAQADPTVLAIGFDDLPPGAIAEVVHARFTLVAAPDHAELQTAHHRSTPLALRLLGGVGRTVELRLCERVQVPAELTLAAERWTAREPFAFQIDAHTDDGWVTVWNGDRELAVGPFATAVRVPLLAVSELDALRFVATSPDDTGVLIDDLELRVAMPMRVLGAHERTPASPVLIGGVDDPTLDVTIDAVGTEQAPRVTRIDLRVDTGAASLASLRVLGDDGRELGVVEFAVTDSEVTERTAMDGAFRTAVDLPMHHGANALRIVATARDDADLDGLIAVHCTAITLSDGRTLGVDARGGSGPQRLGIALRRAGEDGVHTSRIPGLARTRSGTLLAVFDARWRGSRDLPGDIDIALRRSTDGGRHWDAMRPVLDLGEPAAENGVGDPCILVDDVSGRVFVFGLWCRGDTGWNGSRPGLEPGVTGQLLVTWSDDDGLTWSAPRNLTRELKDPAWRLFLQGPGAGITTRDGVLVVPAQFRAADGIPQSTVIWSEDRGANWHVGTGAQSDTTESQVVELADGDWLLNMRDNRGGSRRIAVTADRGQTWTEHPTSRRALVEPICQASLLRFARGGDGAVDDLLLFSNPAVADEPRRHIAIRVSRDDGESWSEGLLLDDGRSAGYSCLAAIDADTVGILYEGSRAQLTFQRVPIAALPGAGSERHRELPR